MRSLLGNAAELLARAQSVNKHKTAFSFLDTILSKPDDILSWRQREGVNTEQRLYLKFEGKEMKRSTNSISWFLIREMAGFENGEDFLGASSGSLGLL